MARPSRTTPEWAQASRTVWLLALLGCGGAWIEGERSGAAAVQACARGEYDSARLDGRCDVEWTSDRSAPAPGAPARDLSQWQPPEQQTMRVEREGQRYVVTLGGALRCRFETPAAHEQELSIPAGTPCERHGHTLRVEQGGARGAGGMLAPTHAVLTVLLSDGPRLVRVDAQLYPQRE